MTPTEFRAARYALGHTQHSMAKALGMNGRWSFQTIGKWECGVSPIPAWVPIAITGLASLT